MIQYRGHDATTEYLLTIYDGGTSELATRPYGSNQSWGAPTVLEVVLAEVTC